MGTSFLNAQKVHLPELHLSGIDFKFTIADEDQDSLNLGELIIFNEDEKFIYDLDKLVEEDISKISIPESGNYRYKFANDEKVQGEIRIIPSWFSILPPLIAIFLALLIRQVIIALAAGIYVGALFIYDYNPLMALLRVSDVFILDALADKDHIYIILFTLLIGGVVGVISANGGTLGIADKITKIAKTARSGMVASWLMGIVIFFDDYANSLIIGNMMRPLTDKLKISREKLAYIVDSTAAPIVSLFIVSTWIGYEVGLINDGLKAIGSEANGYDVFISSIPYGFYPIAAIVFVFLVSFSQRDFGPMYKAEVRARTKGLVSDPNSSIEKFEKGNELFENDKSSWINGAVPILIILFGTITGLFYTGIQKLAEQGIVDYGVQQIISNSDSYSALLWSSFIASITAILMSLYKKNLSLGDAIEAWQKGVQTMMVAAIILVFAWSISTVTSEVKTADFLMSVLSDAISPSFLPLLVFIICAFTGFSTGTSWGTMAIVMPIVIPLTFKLTTEFNLPAEEATYIMYAVISSVLAGSVFGDHCSPIADTTILSSLASRCNHIDHVNTQLPYAIIVGLVTIILGYLPAGFGLNPFISIGLIVSALIGLLIILGKKVPDR